MGMFDSVRVVCPNCGSTVEFQSKAGECSLNDYSPKKVPISIADDINKNVEYCENCGKYIKLHLPKKLRYVEMKVELID